MSLLLPLVDHSRRRTKEPPVRSELYDWTDLFRTLQERGFDPATTFVTGTSSEECSKAAYALNGTCRSHYRSNDDIRFSNLAKPTEVAGQQAVLVAE